MIGLLATPMRPPALPPWLRNDHYSRPLFLLHQSRRVLEFSLHVNFLAPSLSHCFFSALDNLHLNSTLYLANVIETALQNEAKDEDSNLLLYFFMMLILGILIYIIYRYIVRR